MTARPPRLGWLPPLLVGAAAAIAAEVAISMLLYGGPGLVRSLTAILAVEALALGAGLRSAPAPGSDVVDRIRRRWVLGLVSFLVAAVYASAWSFVPMLGEGRASQTVGLAVLAALPIYASGMILGAMAVASASDAGGRLRPPGSAAAIGAALGFVLTGILLPRVPMPGTMLVGCLVLLSLAGMVYGAVLGVRTDISERAHRPMPTGDVSVRERRIEIADLAVVELLEGQVVRRHGPLGEDEAPAPWDVVAARAFMPDESTPWRVLVLGGGASSMPRSMVREHPLVEVDVAERSAAVLELGREYFDTELTVGAGDRMAVATGNYEDLIASIETTYDLVVVDLAALRPLGGLRGLSRAGRWRLLDAVAPGGAAVFGPGRLEPLPPELEGWSTASFVRPEDRSALVVASRLDVTSAMHGPLAGFEPG